MTCYAVVSKIHDTILKKLENRKGALGYYLPLPVVFEIMQVHYIGDGYFKHISELLGISIKEAKRIIKITTKIADKNILEVVHG